MTHRRILSDKYNAKLYMQSIIQNMKTVIYNMKTEKNENILCKLYKQKQY